MTPPSWIAERSRHGGVDEIPLPDAPGRLWLCGKHVAGPDPEAALAAVGADRMVCLCERVELEDRYPDYVAWLAAETATGRALWWPIPDLHAPLPAAVVPFLDQLAGDLAAGRRLLLHCGAGIGRAGTVAAGVLIRMGQTRSAAEATVAAHRPMAGPEAGAQTELLEALDSLARPDGLRHNAAHD